MNKIVKLNREQVEMRASALTPILYTSFFNKDFYGEYNKAIESNAGMFLSEIAYIMHVQAVKESPQTYLKTAKMDEYYEFLDKYPSLEFVNKMADIIAVLLDVQKGNSTAKKKSQ